MQSQDEADGIRNVWVGNLEQVRAAWRSAPGAPSLLDCYSGLLLPPLCSSRSPAPKTCAAPVGAGSPAPPRRRRQGCLIVAARTLRLCHTQEFDKIREVVQKFPYIAMVRELQHLFKRPFHAHIDPTPADVWGGEAALAWCGWGLAQPDPKLRARARAICCAAARRRPARGTAHDQRGNCRRLLTAPTRLFPPPPVPVRPQDTEFPGVVAKPIGEFRSQSEYHFQVCRRAAPRCVPPPRLLQRCTCGGVSLGTCRVAASSCSQQRAPCSFVWRRAANAGQRQPPQAHPAGHHLL